MKTVMFKHIILTGVVILTVMSCKQDVITPKEAATTPPSKGSTDFTKYVAIGNSLTAGFQAGALFTAGQNNSFPKILSTQLSLAQGTTLTFNQPDINSDNGYNSSSSAAAGIALGRLILFAGDGIQAHALPTPAGYPGIPAPYNTVGPSFTDGAFYATSFDKSKLNNFGAPGILLVQCLIPDTGNPAKTAYNPYYARFASNAGVSTIIGDAIAAQPTFFTFDLGNNDILGYATGGGKHATGYVPLTDQTAFSTYYGQAIGLLMANTSAKGIVVTIPEVTSIPFFLTITWNYVTLDATTAGALTTNLSNNYNAFLDGMAANHLISTDEAAKRKLSYTAGNNAILINDETLTDLSPYMTGPYAGLAPYAKSRQVTANELIPLSTGSVLGKSGSFGIRGVSEPLDDQYALIKEEIDSIKTYTASYNNAIKAVAANNSTRIAVADVNTVFNNLTATAGVIENYVLITPSFKPPYGAFSEDGVHPNSRGYAYMANIIINAINNNPSIFGTGINIPKANIAEYAGTGLPYGPSGIIH